MKYLFPIFLSVLICAAHASGPSYVVQVGNQKYTEAELVSMTQGGTQNVFSVIEELKIRETAKYLAGIRGLDINKPEESLYRDFINGDLQKDRATITGAEIPVEMKKASLMRDGIFRQWLSSIAENSIPIRFLDFNRVWELFKQNNSYKIRAEHGDTTKPGNASYTWADLMLDTSTVLASGSNGPFLKGNEFNFFLKQNRIALSQLARRKKTLNQARIDIARLIVSKKILMAEFDSNKEVFTDVEIEREVSDFAFRAMMPVNLDLRNVKANSPSDYMQFVNNKSLESNKGEIDSLRAVLKGTSTCRPNDFETIMHKQNATYVHAQSKISQSIKDQEIYSWMKEKNFKGSFNDAKKALSQELFNKHINDLFLAAAVTITVR